LSSIDFGPANAYLEMARSIDVLAWRGRQAVLDVTRAGTYASPQQATRVRTRLIVEIVTQLEVPGV
jgi:hypothetical protein